MAAHGIGTVLVEPPEKECLDLVVQQVPPANRVEVAFYEGQLRAKLFYLSLRDDLAIGQALGARLQVEDVQLVFVLGQKGTLIPLRNVVVVAGDLLHDCRC